MIWIAITIGAIQIFFAFACVEQIKRKNRLNNWWVLFAVTTGFPAYLAAKFAKPKK